MSEPSCAHQPVSQAHISANGRARRIALCGNPNSGKSTIFNHLTGLNQKVANYPGVTVESRVGRFTLPDNQDIDFDLIDVPGSYSLAAISPDEFIAVKTLIGSDDSSGEAPDLVIVVLDASNLDRSLYLLAQISEARLPTIVVLNQIDIAESRCLRINTVRLSQIIGMPVVSTVAHRGKGINRLKERIARFAEIPPAKSLFTFDHEIEEFLVEFSPSAAVKNSHLSRPELIRALFDKHGPAEKKFLGAYGSGGESKLEYLRRRLADKHRGLPFAEAYPLARKMAHIAQQVTITLTSTRNPATEKIDKIVLHRFWGPLILLGIMIIVFQSIFSWAEPLMDLIDSGAGFVAAQASALLPAGALRSLVVDGVIGGVGSVIIFLPQIVILFFFLGLLEDSGYLPRAAFIVDRLFRWCGLSGKSFVPLLSSFACAIPGIMATRTIDSPRQRLLTIVVAPLMSCSARLPIYIIMISAFVPYERYLGLFNSQGLTMVGLYSLGIITAVIVSFLMKSKLSTGETESFAMELPTYRPPTVKGIWMRTSLSSKAFLKRAGTIIFAITIVIWALSYYPRDASLASDTQVQTASVTAAAEIELASIVHAVDPELSVADFETRAAGKIASSLAQEKQVWEKANEEFRAALARRDLELNELAHALSGEYLRQSFFGRMGRTLEPFFEPLGWDWRITMSVLASFPAREVVIATLGTVYNLGAGEDETSTSLVEKLRGSTWDSGPKAGAPVFNVAVAMSIMVFFALCCQCGATLAIIRRETGSWKWAAFTFTYMTTLAYVSAWTAYRITLAVAL